MRLMRVFVGVIVRVHCAVRLPMFVGMRRVGTNVRACACACACACGTVLDLVTALVSVARFAMRMIVLGCAVVST